mmetsp:Transcript_2573/g.3548  ORF Transcript_2573/g.3548 Transcript_2573/m.3548 type:complete len:124 (-) Transcript_2573:41-412(-)
MESAGPERMAKLKKKVQQVEAWKKVHDMDARITRINEKLKKDMNNAQGNLDRRQAIKSKATLIRDTVINNQTALENEFGRLQGTLRPQNPKFYRRNSIARGFSSQSEQLSEQLVNPTRRHSLS